MKRKSVTIYLVVISIFVGSCASSQLNFQYHRHPRQEGFGNETEIVEVVEYVNATLAEGEVGDKSGEEEKEVKTAEDKFDAFAEKGGEWVGDEWAKFKIKVRDQSVSGYRKAANAWVWGVGTVGDVIGFVRKVAGYKDPVIESSREEDDQCVGNENCTIIASNSTSAVKSTDVQLEVEDKEVEEKEAEEEVEEEETSEEEADDSKRRRDDLL